MPKALILILAIYLLAWQGYKVRTRVNTFGNLCLIVTLVSILAIPVLAKVCDARLLGDLDSRWENLLGNLLVILTCLATYLFRLAIDGYSIHSARVQRTLLGAFLVMIYITGVVVYAVQHNEPVKYSSQPLAISYSLVANGYCASLLLGVAVWMFRTSRHRDRHFKIGLCTAATGLTLIGTRSLSSALLPLIHALGGPDLVERNIYPGTVSSIAAPLFFGGLSYPLVAVRIQVLRRWRQQRRINKSLRRLWDNIRNVYPEIVLSGEDQRCSNNRLFIGGPQRTEFEHTRYIVECYDGIQRLRNFTPDTVPADRLPAATNLIVAMHLHDELHPAGQLATPSPANASGQHDITRLLRLEKALQSVERSKETPSGDPRPGSRAT